MKNKLLGFILVVLCVTAMLLYSAYAANEPYTETVTYESEDSNEEYNFEKRIRKDGTSYQLAEVKCELLSKENKPDGGQVHEIKWDSYVQKVTAYTDYEYVVSNESVPKSKSVTITNEKTGIEESVECSLAGVAQIGKKWVDSYINIRFKDYNSTSFEWQGIQIANHFSSKPLDGYETELLDSVGLTSQTGMVIKTYWTSDAYQEGGVVYRDAKADIKKEVPVYRASYVGEIKTPMETQEATYTSDKEAVAYLIKATAVYEKCFDMNDVYMGIVILLFLIILVISFWCVVKYSDNTKKGGPPHGNDNDAENPCRTCRPGFSSCRTINRGKIRRSYGK